MQTRQFIHLLTCVVCYLYALNLYNHALVKNANMRLKIYFLS
jgi:hypothetical protein